jgi:hypothetical protein
MMKLMTDNNPPSEKVWSPEIRRNESIGDRGLRKWIAEGRFPRPDGNINGRNFWLRPTYERWKAEVLEGRYARYRRPGLTTDVAA